MKDGVPIRYGTYRHRKRIPIFLLTCNGERYDLGYDAAHTVPGDALVAPRVPPRYALYLVEVLRGEVGQVVPVLQPAVLRLREPCTTANV